MRLYESNLDEMNRQIVDVNLQATAVSTDHIIS